MLLIEMKGNRNVDCTGAQWMDAGVFYFCFYLLYKLLCKLMAIRKRKASHVCLSSANANLLPFLVISIFLIFEL